MRGRTHPGHGGAYRHSSDQAITQRIDGPPITSVIRAAAFTRFRDSGGQWEEVNVRHQRGPPLAQDELFGQMLDLRHSASSANAVAVALPMPASCLTMALLSLRLTLDATLVISFATL